MSFLIRFIFSIVVVMSGVGLFFQANVSPALAQEGATGEATEIPPSSNPLANLETIVFSHESTVTHQPFSVTMDNLVGGTIRYTINGSPPDAGSVAYTGAIAVTPPATIIRAQVFANDGTPVGKLYTKSYIIADYEQTIPVISIVTDWANLNTLHTFPEGHGREWERPMTMEYFAPGGESQFIINAGIRIHGHFSRLFSPKKSYRLFFRTQYGGRANWTIPCLKIPT